MPNVPSECLKNTAKDYFDLWRSTKPELPYEQMVRVLVEIISRYPQVLAIAVDTKLASETMLAVDLATLPPTLNWFELVGILNTGLAYVKARCPEIIESPPALNSSSDSLPQLSWPDDSQPISN